ncbi:hypothetical protein CLAIMM_07741 isoform 3 [Cladophialophora immunda]|nr:hypothetical protein CLAIMM_07741 isoform 3 [Cladophialophora immunda]
MGSFVRQKKMSKSTNEGRISDDIDAESVTWVELLYVDGNGFQMDQGMWANPSPSWTEQFPSAKVSITDRIPYMSLLTWFTITFELVNPFSIWTPVYTNSKPGRINGIACYIWIQTTRDWA